MNNKVNIVYIIRHKGWPDYVKIGITSDFNKRLNTLNTASPLGIEVLYTQKVKHKEIIEKHLHAMFAKFRCNGEWFKLNEQQILDAILEIDNLAEK